MKSLLIFASIFCNLCLGDQISDYLGEVRDTDVLLYANYKDVAPKQGWSETVFPHPKDKNSQFVITYVEHRVSILNNHPFVIDVQSGGIGRLNISVRVRQKDWTRDMEYTMLTTDLEPGSLEIYGVHRSCYKKRS